MMTGWWEILISQLHISWTQLSATATLFWSSLFHQFSLLSLLDVILVFAPLWWLYRKLRRTELIKIFPKIFLLLIIVLLARTLGLWALFYVTSALLFITILALGALYAPEIKHILEADVNLNYQRRAASPQTSTGDMQTAIKVIIEALAVLTRAHRPALIVIKKDRSLMRLVDNGTKVNSPLRADLLIDFFTNGSVLSKGAVIVEGNKIVAAGSSLLKPHARVLFSAAHPAIQRTAKELGAVVVIVNKTLGNLGLVYGDNTYKNLALADLTKLLQNILVYQRG